MAFPGFDLFFGSLELVKAHQRNFCIDTGLHHFDEFAKAQQQFSSTDTRLHHLDELRKEQQRVSELVKAQQRVCELDKEQQLLSELEKAQQRYFEAEEEKRLLFEAEEKKRLLFGIYEAIQNLLAADLAKRQKHRLFRLLKVILLLLASTSFLPGLSSTTSSKKILHRKYGYEKAALLIVWRCGDVEQNPGPTDPKQCKSDDFRHFCKSMISLLLRKLLSSKSEKCAHIYKHKPSWYPENGWFGDPSKCTNEERNDMLKNLYSLCVEAKACIPDECSTLIQKFLSIHTKPVSHRELCTERCKEQNRQQCTKQCREQYIEQFKKEVKDYLKRQKRNEVFRQTISILCEDQDAVKSFARVLAANPKIISDINRELELLVKAKESVRGEKSDPSTQPTETTFCSRGQEGHTIISISDETSERKDETDSPMNQSDDTSTTDPFYDTSPTDLGSTNTKQQDVQPKRKSSAGAEMEHSLAKYPLNLDTTNGNSHLDTTNGLELSISSQASVPPSADQENHSACDNHSISAASPTQVTPAGTAVESNALSSNQNEPQVGQRKRLHSTDVETEHSPAKRRLIPDDTNGMELPISYQASVPPIAVNPENHSAWDKRSISVASPTQVTPAGTAVESNAISSNQNEVLPVIDPEYDDVLNENLKGLPASPGDYVGWNSEVFNAITPEDGHNLSNIPSLRTHHLELPTPIKCIGVGTQTDGVPKEDKATEMEWVWK